MKVCTMLLGKKQAAARLGICADTLLTLTGRGDIIGFKLGGQWKFDERDIDIYIDRLRKQAAQRTIAAHTKQKKNRPQVDSGIAPVWLPGMKIQDVCARKSVAI